MSHTYALLPVSDATYEEIEKALKDAYARHRTGKEAEVKIPDAKGNVGALEAGAFVVMQEDSRGWIRPIASCSRMEIALSKVAAMVELDCELACCGGIPGEVKFYIVPVEAK